MTSATAAESSTATRAPSSSSKARRLAQRESRIVGAARAMAEEHGWEFVTTRRLADAIDYSQPVLYGHFPEGRAQIVTAVALAGFEELAAGLAAAIELAADATGPDRVRALVVAYLDFADRQPATYEAMFAMPIGAAFAAATTPRALRDGFEAIVSALRSLDRPPADLETAAEVLWAAMHGVATLRRAARYDPAHHERRVDELVRSFAG